jgi:hypothetical protein
MSGGDGSYWNYHRTWTSKDIAGANAMTISVGKIRGSYYGKSGMNISYNAADGKEEFESTLKIEASNVTIKLRVLNWKTGKPATLEEIDRVGQYVVDQVVRLSEPITTLEGWLDFCGTLDRLIDPSVAQGVYFAPEGYKLDSTGNLKKEE